jgi:hypothetical protein
VQELGLRQLSVVPLTLSSQSDTALQEAFLHTPEQEISSEVHCGVYTHVCVKTGVPVQFETEFVCVRVCIPFDGQVAGVQSVYA